MVERELSIAFIQLSGLPYQREVEGGRVDASRTLDGLAANAGYTQRVVRAIRGTEEHMQPLFRDGGYYAIDKKLKHGEELSFDDAFSLVAFVAASLNRPLYEAMAPRINHLGSHDTHIKQSVALLSAMSAKEAYVGLTAAEIAGMVAATISLDTVARLGSDRVMVALGGMGGDRGYPLAQDKSKLFSLSTLAACGLAVDGAVHKHHSYPNTSKISGQSAIEAFGARSDFFSTDAMGRVLDLTQLLMTSCHDTRTLHTISHQLRGETINHVIGPLAFTMEATTRLHAFVGVNEKVHPETIIQALGILSARGFQTYGNSVAFCGTDLKEVPTQMLSADAYTSSVGLKGHVMLDEVAPPPYATIAAFLKDGKSAGSFMLLPEDFYDEATLQTFAFGDLVIPNVAEVILDSNRNALSGKDMPKARYLAMTMGLGLFTRHYLDRVDALHAGTRRVNRRYLQKCTRYAYEILMDGKAGEKLEDYVEATKLYCGDNLRRITL